MLKPGHCDVRMVRERIDAVVDGDTATVRCDFSFKNEGKGVTVTMGFPVASEDTDGYGYTEYPVPSEFGSFASWVNGRRVTTKYISPKDDDDNHNDRYWGWYVKEVHFEPGENVRVLDRYDGPLEMWNDQTRCYFGYILESGANWKGKIGEADINVVVRKRPTVGDPPYREVMRFNGATEGFTREGNQFTWRLRDFEPRVGQDIEVRFSTVPGVDGIDPWAGLSPFIDHGRLFVQISACPEFRCVERLRGSKHLLRVKYGNEELTLTKGARRALLNGRRRVYLPAAPRLEGYFRVPIASVVRALGGTAYYDKTCSTVYLKLPAASRSTRH